MTRRVSWGGLLTALTLILVIARFYSPTADLAILSLTSLCIAIAVIELGVRPAIVVYLAAALLSLAFPGLAAAYPFLFLFGPYPLVRACIDGHFRRQTAILLKLAAGNILTGLAILIFAWPAATSLAGQYGSLVWIILPAGLQVILLLYDYVLSMLIQFYMLRLHRS